MVYPTFEVHIAEWVKGYKNTKAGMIEAWEANEEFIIFGGPCLTKNEMDLKRETVIVRYGANYEKVEVLNLRKEIF